MATNKNNWLGDAADENSPLNRAIKFAICSFEKAGRDRSKMPEPVETVLLVESAQGIIDNGGFQFLFESNFEDDTSYDEICAAYRRIGADDCADMLEEAVAMFPFLDPHLNQAARLSQLEGFQADHDSPFWELDNDICGNDLVWEKLSEYVQANQSAFS